MKKVILTIVWCAFMFLEFTGCIKEKKVSIDDLNSINDKIIEYFKINGVEEYNNYSYNYVDEENKLVIVGLVDSSEKEQEWFKKNIVDSKYIKFEQGEHLKDEYFDVSEKIDVIINNGPHTSSNPFDYVKTSQNEYDELLNHPKETFEYAIKDLIDTDAKNGLKSYIEALLCKDINKNFEYDFESANDYLEHYKEFLTRSYSDFNEYDKYAKALLK